jgi:hypothetical protein
VNVTSFGDCITCDGYILTVSEAPYCPTCAREHKEAEMETVTFEFRSVDGGVLRGSLTECRDALTAYAWKHGLALHLHRGSWAGFALSSAYARGGDNLFDAQAVVKAVRS